MDCDTSVLPLIIELNFFSFFLFFSFFFWFDLIWSSASGRNTSAALLSFLVPAGFELRRHRGRHRSRDHTRWRHNYSCRAVTRATFFPPENCIKFDSYPKTAHFELNDLKCDWILPWLSAWIAFIIPKWIIFYIINLNAIQFY